MAVAAVVEEAVVLAAVAVLAAADAVRRSLVTWWRVFPHAICFGALMLAWALSIDFWLAMATILLAAISWRLFAELRERSRRPTP